MEVTDELYETMTRRDTRFDGCLYVGIVSTGIVCFPSCKSRLPKRENVRVFHTVQDALRMGFRPCKRCKPELRDRSPDSDLVQQVMAVIQKRYDEPWTLRRLSEEVNISPYHLQRLFTRSAAVSPARYLQSTRIQMAKVALAKKDARIADVARQVGFRSASGESFETLRGWLDAHVPRYRLHEDVDRLAPYKKQLSQYFRGERQKFTIPLDFRGTAFQTSVWRALIEIPYGQLRSYTDIANVIQNPKAVRAVGAANGSNPLPIVVPCHRVVGKNGNLTGYRGGLALKERLLSLEGCWQA